MAAAAAFEVSTKVLTDQARVTLRDLKTPDKAPRITELKGLDADFKDKLEEATASLERDEAEQERLKQLYVKETGEDQALAELGYRWVLEGQANARTCLAGHDVDPDDLPGALRFGHLSRPRARGVVYELRIVLPEYQRLITRLGPFGCDEAFIARGSDILAKLAVEQQETADAKAAREACTRKVRAGEIKLSRMLRQLRAADEAASIRIPSRAPSFRLDTIDAELARLAAERAAHAAAQSDTPRPIED